MIKYSLLLFSILLTHFLHAQMDSAKMSEVFQRIGKEMGTFRPDTTTPPADKMTGKINELRSLRGGFNISEAIEFKIQDDLNNKKITVAESKAIQHYFTTGKGKTLLDNAVNHIYRQHFNYKEMKSLVKFYRTSAGQKMASDFPFIMLKSLAAAEMLVKQVNGE